jgi:carbonic anhydrase
MTKPTTHVKSEAARPTYIAYHVHEAAEPGGKGRWIELGAFFAHRDGQGGNLVLDALPISFTGRIVLRAPSRKPE